MKRRMIGGIAVAENKIKNPIRPSLDPGWEWPAVLSSEERILITHLRRCADNLAKDPETMQEVDLFIRNKKWGGIHPRINSPVMVRVFSYADEAFRPSKSSGAGMAIVLIVFMQAAYRMAEMKNKEEK